MGLKWENVFPISNPTHGLLKNFPVIWYSSYKNRRTNIQQVFETTVYKKYMNFKTVSG